MATFTLKGTFSKEVAKKITMNVIEELPKQASKWSLKEVMKFGIRSLSTFKGMIIYIGTVPYTIDQIYLALYGNDSDRQRSGIGMLWNWLYAKGPIPNISNIDTGHWDKNDEYTNPQIDAEREKKLKDEILAKFIVEVQARMVLFEIGLIFHTQQFVNIRGGYGFIMLVLVKMFVVVEIWKV